MKGLEKLIKRFKFLTKFFNVFRAVWEIRIIIYMDYNGDRGKLPRIQDNFQLFYQDLNHKIVKFNKFPKRISRRFSANIF